MVSVDRGEYAGFFRRFFATAIDIGLSYLLTWVVMSVTGVWSVVSTMTKMGISAQTGQLPTYFEPINVDLVLRGYQITSVFTVAYTIYLIAALASPMRGTLGKFVLNVAVVNTSGQRIGLFQALARELLKAVWIAIAVFLFSFIAPYLLSGLMMPFIGALATGSIIGILGFILVLLFTAVMLGVVVGIGMFFNDRRRNVYDFLAGTMAVYAADWEDEKPAKISVLRRLGGIATLLIFGVFLSVPVYGLVQGGRTEVMEPLALQLEEINAMMAAMAEQDDSGLRPDPSFEGLKPRKRAIDWTGVELVQQVVEEHAVSKQQFPQSFNELGLSNGTLLEHGITRVEVLNNNVFRIGFSSESEVTGSELVLVPYIDADGYLGWSCRSHEIREVDFPEFCDD